MVEINFQNPWGAGSPDYDRWMVDGVNNWLNPPALSGYASLPSFQELKRNYPSFNATTHAHPCDIAEYIDQCAIRLSTAFYLTGVTFENESTDHKNDFCPDHGFKHIRSAPTFATSLLIKKYGYGVFQEYTPVDFQKKFGKPLTDESFVEVFKSFTGIMFQYWNTNGGAHIDLFDKGSTGSGNYADRVGSSSYSGAKIMFWKVK
jgi:hypothetical protein